MELGERIRWLLDRFGSRAAAAETAGVTPEHLASYIAGRAKPPFELIARLARVQNVSLDWLASGEGERVTGGEPEGFARISLSAVDASSGPGAYARDDEEREDIVFSRAWLSQHVRVPEESLIVVLNRGGANAPDIGDGDAMLVDRSAGTITDDAFYIFDRGGFLLTKLVEMYVDGRVALKTRNPDSGVQILSRQDAANVKVFGRVRWRGGIV
jgi:phage repressor protein C with HTH and peptisase S24 domain